MVAAFYDTTRQFRRCMIHAHFVNLTGRLFNFWSLGVFNGDLIVRELTSKRHCVVS